MTSNPNYWVAIANQTGRSCTSTPGPSSTGVVRLDEHTMSEHRMAHEGGHMALGTGDEYPNPGAPVERERVGDWSLMAYHDAFAGWALLHERHFAFAPAFLRQVLPACTPRLVEVSRPVSIELRGSFTLGYSYYAGGHGAVLGGGLDIGLTGSRQRGWEALLGLHGSMLSRLDQNARIAFLAGARLSLEGDFARSAGGFRAGAYGELGVGAFSDPSTGGYQRGAYGELGGVVGYTSPGLFIGAEGAYGTRLDTNDPNTQRWFRLGLQIGGRF